jgi:sigma-B regulation protein RsbU (phosphoserine phosphatase)
VVANDPKLRYRCIAQAVERATGPGSPKRYAERLMPQLVTELGQSEGLRGAALYQRKKGALSRVGHVGAEAAESIDDQLREKLSDGVALIDFPLASDVADGMHAVFAVTPAADLLMALEFAPDHGPLVDRLTLVTALQYAVHHELRRRELENDFEQARAIQTSLLPAAAPAFGDFDIAAFSLPTRRVGGDLYDFLALDPDTLGIAVADASGHGLPAALQARDVVTGLRMGVERDLRLTRTVEKLNRVIHRSGLTTRFVSLVFGELERNGTLIYVNAGHPPPLLLGDHFDELSVGGVLLGPYPDAAFKMGFAHVDRGAALLFYTDGVIERHAPDGEMFGRGRLEEWMRGNRGVSAAEALADLTRTLGEFAGGMPAEDDVTAVFLRRPE